MGALKSFEELEVWKKAIDLTEAVYQASRRWPADERFGLVQQIRRSASSVAANIAEGAERPGTKEFLRFLGIARGSLAETKTFLILAERLSYLEKGEAEELKNVSNEVGRMLSGLTRSLQSRLTE
jgi:four helix bundle protein